MFHFTLNATFHAALTPVFEAFHKPELLMQWFAPGDVMVSQVMSDFREGGRYRIVLLETSGQQYALTGQYTHIVTNEHLAFSWAWEDNQEESVITAVDIRFDEQDKDTTHVTLTHSGFMNEAERDQHQHGWMACLEKLASLPLSDTLRNTH